MLRIVALLWKTWRTAGIVVSLELILFSKKTDIRKHFYIAYYSRANPIAFRLAYDRGWRVRTDWKQYQLLKQYVFL